MTSPSKEHEQMAKADRLRTAWWLHHKNIKSPVERSKRIQKDIFEIRNGILGQTGLPAQLRTADDEVLAALEHYFLCRWWVGSGRYPSWEVWGMVALYNISKEVGVTPRFNASRPPTPLSNMQMIFQQQGICSGEKDLAASGNEAATVAMPPLYFL